jgi:hypothetical protein
MFKKEGIMKVMNREIMKVLPGKMGEAMELMQKHMAAATRLGVPPGGRGYRCISGGGDYFHTVVSEMDWDSLAAMEAFHEKTLADPEMQRLYAKWEAVLESHVIEVYTPMQ